MTEASEADKSLARLMFVSGCALCPRNESSRATIVAERLSPERSAAKQRIDLATAMLDETRQALAERDARIKELEGELRYMEGLIRPPLLMCYQIIRDLHRSGFRTEAMPYGVIANAESMGRYALRRSGDASMDFPGPDELSNKEPADGK